MGSRPQGRPREAPATCPWLAETDVDGDPLGDPTARDWAVRDYRAQLKTVAKAAPTTINNHLAALDDFHTRRGLGTAAARREDLPRRSAPKALSNRDALRWLRTVEKDPNTRDTVIALLPYYAGLRIGEVVTRTRTTKIVYCPSSPENSFR